MDLGERLYELRKSKNLTQDDVAERLNVTRQTVSKWETNQSTPDFDKIIPLCELYEISSDELLKGKKDESEAQSDDEKQDSFNWDEAKKHIFARGKEDKISYENMTKNQIKQKSADVVSSSILLFIIAIAYCGIAASVLNWNGAFVGCTFLILVGIGVTRIVKHYMSIPKFDKTEEEIKEDKLVKQINDVIMAICVVIYFIVSFTTMAWYITWIIFIIGEIICRIAKLIIMLKEDEDNEE